MPKLWINRKEFYKIAREYKPWKQMRFGHGYLFLNIYSIQCSHDNNRFMDGRIDGQTEILSYILDVQGKNLPKQLAIYLR